jgi:hypothetical protein
MVGALRGDFSCRISGSMVNRFIERRAFSVHPAFYVVIFAAGGLRACCP